MDGWYAVAADDFTYASVRQFTRTYAGSLRCRQSDGRRQVVVGYDRRFGSERLAAVAAAELARAGIDVAVTSSPAPTPAVVGALLAMKADGGLMIGGANLPAAFNGIQAWIDDGSRINPAAILNSLNDHPAMASAKTRAAHEEPGTVISIDLLSAYRERLSRLIGLERLRSAGLTFVVDVMFGAAAGLVSTLFTGDATEGVELNHIHNPLFPGIGAPDPVEPNLNRLRRIVIDGEAMLGLALDGTGERLGVVDEQGRFIDDRLVSLLLARLVYESRRARGPIIKAASATSGLDRMVSQWGVKLIETAPGWPSLSLAAVREHASLAVDGAGGYAIGEHLPDRDGLAAGLLLVDYCLRTQRSLSELIAEVEPLTAGSVYLRQTVPRADRTSQDVTDQLQRLAPPVTVSGETFTSGRMFGDGGGVVDAPWALKLKTEDGSWLLLQLDACQGQLVMTAEAETREQAERLLTAGSTLASGRSVG